MDIRITVACQDDYFVTQVRGKQHWDLETDRCFPIPFLFHAFSVIVKRKLPASVQIDPFLPIPVGTRTVSGSISERWIIAALSGSTENMPDPIREDLLPIPVRLQKFPHQLSTIRTIRKTQFHFHCFPVNIRRDSCLFNPISRDPIDNKIHLWEPGQPNLYDLVLEVYQGGVLQDRVETA